MGSVIRNRGTDLEDLTEQQRLFALEWVKTRSPTKALTAGGYALTGDRTTLARHYAAQCAEYIHRLETLAARRALVSIGAIQSELTFMAYSNPLDYFTIDEVTGLKRPKKLDELTREEGVAIQDFSMEWFGTDKDDPLKGYFVLKDVKLADKRKCLVDLGKTVGLFANTPPPTGSGNLPADQGMLANLPTADLKALEDILRKAATMVSSARDRGAIPVSSEALVAGAETGTTGAAAAVAHTSAAPAPRPASKEQT